MLDFTFNIDIDNVLSLIITKIFNNIFIINFSGNIEGISNADDFIIKLKDKLKEQTMEDKIIEDVFYSHKNPSKSKKFTSSYTFNTV